LLFSLWFQTYRNEGNSRNEGGTPSNLIRKFQACILFSVWSRIASRCWSRWPLWRSMVLIRFFTRNPMFRDVWNRVRYVVSSLQIPRVQCSDPHSCSNGVKLPYSLYVLHGMGNVGKWYTGSIVPRFNNNILFLSVVKLKVRKSVCYVSVYLATLPFMIL